MSNDANIHTRGNYSDCIRDGFTETAVHSMMALNPLIKRVVLGDIQPRHIYMDGSLKSYKMWVLHIRPNEYRFFDKRSQAVGMKMLHSLYM